MGSIPTFSYPSARLRPDKPASPSCPPVAHPSGFDILKSGCWFSCGVHARPPCSTGSNSRTNFTPVKSAVLNPHHTQRSSNSARKRGKNGDANREEPQRNDGTEPGGAWAAILTVICFIRCACRRTVAPAEFRDIIWKSSLKYMQRGLNHSRTKKYERTKGRKDNRSGRSLCRAIRCHL